MANRRTTKRAGTTTTRSSRRTTTAPAKRTTRRGRPPRVTREQQPSPRFSDYFRFGESYTSLILGIIVVIIASILLVTFVKNRNIGKISQPNPQIISQQTQNLTPGTASISAMITESLSPTSMPTHIPTRSVSPTIKPTKAVATPTKAIRPTSIPKVTPVPTTGQPPKNLPASYTVKTGDDLWNIAQKEYGSGYNWVDIANANNLTMPNILFVGTKLTLPKVAPKLATTPSQASNMTIAGPKISGSTYTIQHGDNLWNIAVRAYNDGYQWTKIAKANNLTQNPGLIHSGNTIKIPRT